MSFKHEPIPVAAKAAGMTRLVFAEDFEGETAIDFSGEGKPEYSFYADRPYSMATLTPEECQMRDSVLYFCPEKCGSAIGLPTYSKAGKTGFTMTFGYAEARIRADLPTGKFNGVPAFWGIGLRDFMGTNWDRCGELDILEMIIPSGRPNDVKIYTGTLHEHYRSDEVDENGRRRATFATNLVNATGYRDQFDYIDGEWHTYAALWEPGYVAWYMDNKLMHAARFTEGELPQYYYRDDPTPLPRIEHERPELAYSTWTSAHCVMNDEQEVLFLGCNKTWPMEVDWVRVWQK